jgi:predicted nucleotide-binding protein (sugar kinase/HSP70/actin superfamily)
MEGIARLAAQFYDVEARGGEGHMEVGKVIHTVKHRKADMIVSVKPFGCMPSSSVSDGVQSLVVHRLPEALFCPVETTGDGAVNFQSRIQMFLFKAKRRAKEEFETALRGRGWTLAEARRVLRRAATDATLYPRHVAAGTATNLVLGLRR